MLEFKVQPYCDKKVHLVKKNRVTKKSRVDSISLHVSPPHPPPGNLPAALASKYWYRHYELLM